MKKIRYIIIPIIALSILLAPISPAFEKQNGQLALETEINKAEAEVNEATIDIEENGKITTTSANFKIKINDVNGTYFTTFTEEIPGVVSGSTTGLFSVTVIPVIPTSESSNYENTLEQNLIRGEGTCGSSFPCLFKHSYSVDKTQPQTIEIPIDGLEKNTEYYMFAILLKATNTGSIRYLYNLFSGNENFEAKGIKIKKVTFITAKDDNTSGSITTSKMIVENPEPAYSLQCGVTNLGGCIAQILYTIWGACAFIAELTGKLLDFFVYYSTNSDSYTSIFITKAWSAIRDIANIFFIIALIYVAIKTILSLGGVGSKKLIGYIILFALLINFSLFITQVVIDSSNILAKVFYNQIKSVDKNGNPLPAGGGGEKSISVGLIRGYNPQQIIKAKDYSFNIGKFIFITFLLIALTLYTAYMFFVVAILFVSRVVSLWISMIFAPFAFASYTVPFDIPGFGHKKWWSDLFQAAFLAPIFIFFLYIIVMFVEFGKNAVYETGDSPDFIQTLMKAVIPFAIIFILLMRAKKLAVDMSGELGAAMTKIGGAVVGVAGGAAALLGTGVIGGLASKVAGSEGLKTAAEKKGLGGWAARMAMRTATIGSKATFDIRKTAAGGALGKAMGADFTSAKYLGLGPKEGGFKGITERRAKKIEEGAENTKTRMTDDEVKAWNIKRGANAIKDADGNLITTAEGLNNHRVKEYANNIGKNDLISSAVYSAGKKFKPIDVNSQEVKDSNDKKANAAVAQEQEKRRLEGKLPPMNAQEIKDFEKDWKSKNTLQKEKENMEDARTKKTKLIIGAVAVTGAGIGGGLLGGALGAGALGGEALKQQEAERLTKASMSKQIKILQGIEDRLKDLGERLKDQQKFFDDQKASPSRYIDPATGNPIDLFTAQNKVDKDGVDKALAVKEAEKQDIIQQLKILNKKIAKQGGMLGNDQRDKNRFLGKSAAITVETSKLNELKGIEEKITNTQQSMYNLGKDKTKATTPTAKGPTTGFKPYTPTGGGGGGHAPTK